MSFNVHVIGANPSRQTVGGTLDVPVPFSAGTRAIGADGTEWLFCSAASAISAGQVCQITAAHAASPITTSGGLRGLLVGVPRVAIGSGNFGWFQVKGPADVQVAASVPANTRLNTTTTAGQLDASGTAGSREIVGLHLTTASGASAGLAPGMLNYPMVGPTL